MHRWLNLVLLAAALAAVAAAETAPAPEQLHLAVGANPTEMAVMWTTQVNGAGHIRGHLRPATDGGDDTPAAVVRYGTSKGSLGQTTTGKSVLFTDGGSERRQIVTYTVRLTSLVAGTTYHYQVGDGQSNWSDVRSFTTLPADPNARPIKYVVYGDLGLENGVSLAPIAAEVQTLTGADKIDVVTHIGDFAYDIHDDQGRKGDGFMREAEKFAAYVPYMVSPGNHEQAYNFSHYTERFDGMPYPQSGGPNNWWYSYDIGLVHWVSISTEVYFMDGQEGKDLVKQQYDWLVNDLVKANANRKAVPWVVMVGHRMMYCSCDSDRVEESVKVRAGISVDGHTQYGLEDLAHKFGVDMYIAGHNHNTERSYPVYNFKVEDQDMHLFKNPTAMVHLVAGAAGGPEQHRPFNKVIGPFSAFHSLKYGYGHLVVYNSTHMYWEMVNAEDGGSIDDHMWLVQDKHGPHTGLNAVHSAPIGPTFFSTYGLEKPMPVTPGKCPVNVRVCEVGAEARCECVRQTDEGFCEKFPCDEHLEEVASP